tara:strand:+ start:78063 stop:78296 length:234 start_codon:yes stop_codon:yes gene_type:complete
MTAHANAIEDRPLVFLRANDVCGRIGCSRSQLYNYLEQDPTFPRPFKDGDSKQAKNFWVESEVEDWMRARMARATRA